MYLNRTESCWQRVVCRLWGERVKSRRVVVAGGSGFIGSHLVDALMVKGFSVKVVDDLSSGSLKNVESWIGDSRFEFVQGDLKDLDVACRSVGEAEVAVRQAFNATLDAERAGANVSGLILRLDEAGGILTEAEIALKDGNSSEAASKAVQCIGIAESVKSDAYASKASALEKAQTVFWTSLTFSVAGIVVFVVVLMLVWRWFKRGYVGKMLGMKPEVTTGEA
jgi:hypothetical protein